MLQNPETLLDQPAIAGIAPWCIRLDNLELGILLFAQPFAFIEPLRVTDIHDALLQLSGTGLLGHVYFQRVSRAVTRLEEAKIIRGRGGAGKSRRYLVSPEGFVALLLNLRALKADPTIDASEFELKRELVASWHVLLDRLRDTGLPFKPSAEMAAFFDAIDRVMLGDQAVLNAELVEDTFNIHRLIQRQRVAVEQLRSRERQSCVEAERTVELLRSANIATVAQSAAGPKLQITPEILEVIKVAAASKLPVLSARGNLARYEAYLSYLKNLDELYSPNFKGIALDDLRRIAKGAGK